MLSNFFTITFFFDILIAPRDRLEDRITGNNKGVIPIAIATANVKAVIDSCFQAFIKKTIGIKISINFIRRLLILEIPVSKADLGF